MGARGYTFLPCDRDPRLLMPPALQDWLPEGDLAWFILEAGAPMKLGAIERTYRTDGWEQAAYESAMLVALLRYADGLPPVSGKMSCGLIQHLGARYESFTWE